MKDYKEVAREVFARRDEYLIKQKKRRKAVAAIASFCVALCVVVGVAVGYERVVNTDGGIAGATEASGIESTMSTPTVTTTSPGEPDPDYEPGKHFGGFPPLGTGDVDDPYNGTAETIADRAGAAVSELVVYGTVTDFDELGTDILCTLTVERTMKGEETDTVSFNISETDREGFMALVKGGKGVFFLKSGEHGYELTHGSPSIFYEAGEDDFRSYDETGLICFNLTMEEIENLTEAGL